ncbi:MAG: hypothetical protein HC837_10345 [Chloroflexaceae bacterium]|nr:hypothetical protein [Chloroflexaceae bacterium]
MEPLDADDWSVLMMEIGLLGLIGLVLLVMIIVVVVMVVRWVIEQEQES